MVSVLGLIIMVVGSICALVYGIKLLILMFQENVLWGLAGFFFGFPSLIFVAMHWNKSGGVFIKALLANLAAGVGATMFVMASGQPL